MAGGTVASLLEDGTPDVERTLAVATDVCRALSFMHAQGLIHRDLKPSNIFLAEDGTAKVGDFGLAVALDRSRITQQGSLVGTAAYMPPEQALGGEVTPQSDLYALGAMLYELVTGSPPFQADDPTAVISQHINTPPVAPSWHTEACPPALEEVILTLLQKDAGKRPESADRVLASLSDVDPTQRSRSHSDSNVLDRLARGVFAGREKEMEKLRSAFDDAFAGRGSVVMLVGEPGIGKTRTAQEVETYARVRGADVLWGRTHESSGAPPYLPWIQVGNTWGSRNDRAAMRPKLGGAAAHLTRLFPELEQDGYPPPPEGIEPEIAQFQLFDAYVTFVRAIADVSPAVLILDDLHWADRPTLKLLQHLARELASMRVLIVGTYRDTDVDRTHPLSEALAELNREGAFERISLRGLSRQEVSDYIGAVQQSEPAAELARRIHEETEGNPFFLSEMVNLMAEEGTLTRDTLTDVRLPEGVREALGRRLDRLSNEANEMLKVASVVGREFAHETLSLVTEHSDDMLLGLVEEGLGGRVIEESGQPGTYRFTHALMRETLLDELSTTRRVRLHGLIGEALEQRYGDRARDRASELAHHFVESAALKKEHAERALQYSGVAGQEALERLAWSDAAVHFEHALEQVHGEGASNLWEEAELQQGLGTAYVTMGQHDAEGLLALEQAFRVFADRADADRTFSVSQVIGTLPAFGGDSAEALLLEALSLQEENSAARGLLEVYVANRLAMRGSGAEALSRLANALSIAESLDDEHLTMVAYCIRGFVTERTGRDGLSDHLRAAALAERLGDARRVAAEHSLAAYSLLWGHLELDGAREHADKRPPGG